MSSHCNLNRRGSSVGWRWRKRRTGQPIRSSSSERSYIPKRKYRRKSTLWSQEKLDTAILFDRFHVKGLALGQGQGRPTHTIRTHWLENRAIRRAECGNPELRVDGPRAQQIHRCAIPTHSPVPPWTKRATTSTTGERIPPIHLQSCPLPLLPSPRLQHTSPPKYLSSRSQPSCPLQTHHGILQSLPSPSHDLSHLHLRLGLWETASLGPISQNKKYRHLWWRARPIPESQRVIRPWTCPRMSYISR